MYRKLCSSAIWESSVIGEYGDTTWSGWVCMSPDGDALGLEISPALVHLLEPPGEDGGVLLRVQAAHQLLARAVQAEIHVAVLLHLILQVLQHINTASTSRIAIQDNAFLLFSYLF